jgi:hypothetical protein
MRAIADMPMPPMPTKCTGRLIVSKSTAKSARADVLVCASEQYAASDSNLSSYSILALEIALG